MGEEASIRLKARYLSIHVRQSRVSWFFEEFRNSLQRGNVDVAILRTNIHSPNMQLLWEIELGRIIQGKLCVKETEGLGDWAIRHIGKLRRNADLVKNIS